MGKQIADGVDKKDGTARMRRWVSVNKGLNFLEPSDELRDPGSRKVLEYKSRVTGQNKRREDLWRIRFQLGQVLWPPKSPFCYIRMMGVFKTDEPDKIAFLEKETERLEAKGDTKTLMEYPLEWETEVRADPMFKIQTPGEMEE
jgi:hypothetical protein